MVVVTDAPAHQSGSRPVAVPLYNPTDLQTYRHHHGNLHFHGYPANLAPQYAITVAAPIAPTTNYGSQGSYAFMLGPGTPSGIGVTPGQILNSDVGSALNSKVKSPYNRPLSAQEVQPPEPPPVPNSPQNQWSSLASNSTSSISSVGSNGGNMTNAVATIMPTPLSLQGKPGTPTSLQTNSFMRPQSTYKLDPGSSEGSIRTATTAPGSRSLQRRHNDRVTRPAPSVAAVIAAATAGSKATTRPASRTLTGMASAAAPLAVSLSGRSTSSPANQRGAHLPLSRQVPMPREMPLDMKPPVSPLSKAAGITADHNRKGTSFSGADSQKKVIMSPLRTGINKKPRLPQSPSSMKKFSTSNATIQTSVANDSYGSEPVVMNTAHGMSILTGNTSPAVEEPKDSVPFRPGTPAAEAAAKVRNLNYTPTKPYSEVGEATHKVSEPTHSKTDSTTTGKVIKTGVGSTPRTARRLRVESTAVTKPTPPKLTRPTSSRHVPHADAPSRHPVSSQGNSVNVHSKRMPVTNTVTGTVYYRKQSKSEEVIHELKRRPRGDGATTRPRTVERGSGESGSDEWEDEEVDADSMAPGSERLPGDGEDDDDDVSDDDDDDEDDDYDDDDDDDSAIDDIDDDIDSGSDNESETNASSLSRQGSTLRLRSATRRMLGLALDASTKPRSRPSTGCSRSASRLSVRSSESEMHVALTPSLFPNIPPTINFVTEDEKVELLPWELRRMLRWRMSPITPNVVKNCIARSGFRATKKNHDWIGCWGKHMKAQAFKAIREYQKVNHFPGSFQIGRKDRLWRNLSRMQVHFGKKEWGFFPQTYVLPFDLKQLKRVWDDGGCKQKWIIKPPASARGIGIRVVHKWNQIPKRRPVIVQKYLGRPYLINGSKFDLRVYVYVSCYDPLRIYVYDDGLVRFASCKYSYSTKNLSNRYMHLTNYSVNKRNNEYESNTDENVCQGHKWGLKALWGYLKKQGTDTSAVWDKIKDLVVKTIISSEACVNSLVKANCHSSYSVHELFGFDVMLDEDLKPWIIEVNISPSLHSNSQLDINIKGGMIRDLLNMSAFMIPDKNDVALYPGANVDSSKSTAWRDVCMDKRLYPGQMSTDERSKHAYYSQRYQDELVQSSILETLTPDDLRILTSTIDEDSRRGNFLRVFPSVSSHRYLRYLEQPRYYNLLVNSWVQRYHRMEARGVAFLESLCDQGIHLDNPTDNPRHQWSPPSLRDPRVTSAPTAAHAKHGGSLPKLKKRLAAGSVASIHSTPRMPNRTAGISREPS